MNNKLLELKNSNEIPDIEPIKRKDEKGVSLNLPSGGIGFWVIPNLKVFNFFLFTIYITIKLKHKLANLKQNTFLIVQGMQIS